MMDDKSPRLNQYGEKYIPAGGKVTYHGGTYQLRLLTWFMLKGIANKYSFSLATDMKDADKFDDVVFRYTRGAETVYRFLQAKHKKNKDDKITFNALLSTGKHSDFSLAMYFHSFRNLKKRFVDDTNKIEDVIICSNSEFKYDDYNKELDLRLGDVIAYRGNRDHILQTRLQGFRKKFKGRDEFFRTLKKNILRLSKVTHSNDNSNNNNSASCGEIEGDDGIEKDMESFLEKITFAMGLPGVQELKEKIKTELSDVYTIVEAEMCFSVLEQNMYEWMSKPEGTYLTFEDGSSFIRKLQQKYGSIKYLITDPVKNFTGRKKEIKMLIEAHRNNEGTVVIAGLGGVGKSQLAKEFVRKYKKEFDSFVWIEADSQKNLMTSFKKLAEEKMNINLKTEDGKEKDIRFIRDEVYQHFHQRKCVFIFDNVEIIEGKHDYLHTFLPTSNPKPFLILTSRYRNWEGLRVINLEVFSETEAITLIKKSLGEKVASDGVQVLALAQELQYFPLSLQQALAYIKREDRKSKCLGKETGIEYFLEEFRKGQRSLLSHRLEKFGNHMYEKTTSITWNITLEKILEHSLYGETAIKILFATAFFFPDRIPATDIAKCLKNVDEETVFESLLLLHDYFMLTLDEGIATVHRLVQMATIDKLKAANKDKGVIDWMMESSMEYEMQNNISLWQHIEQYEDLVKKHSMLPKHIMRSLTKAARYQEACLFGEQHLKKLRVIIGSADEDVMEAMFEWVIALQSLGEYEKALKIHEESIESQVVFLDKRDPKNIWRVGHKAHILYDMNRLEDALIIYRSVHEDLKELLGENNEDTLASLVNIAAIYHARGQWKEALAMSNEILKKQQEILGSDHINTLQTMHNIADVKKCLCMNDEALEIFKEIYPKECTILGENHPATMSTQFSMASILHRQGKYEVALNMYREIEKKQATILGENHRETMITKDAVGKLLQNLGKLDEALSIYEDVHKRMKHTLGDNHGDTLLICLRKASILHAKRKYNEAEMMYHEAYQGMKNHHGDNHPHSLHAKERIAKVLHDRGKYEEAYGIYRGIYETEKKLFGKYAPRTLQTEYKMVVLLRKQKKIDEAFLRCKWLQQKYLETSGEENIEALRVKKEMAFLLLEKKNFEESLKAFREVCSMQTGTNDSHTSKSKIFLELMTQQRGENRQETKSDVLVKEETCSSENHDDERLLPVLDKGRNEERTNQTQREPSRLIHILTPNDVGEARGRSIWTIIIDVFTSLRKLMTCRFNLLQCRKYQLRDSEDV